MILTDEKIVELILKPENGDVISRACELSRQHIRHIKGIGVTEFFKAEQVKGYENEEEKLLREKISRATTVPIFSNALSTFDKAYSASGYSRYFDFSGSSDSLRKDLQAYLNGNIGEGLSMPGWMQQIWGDKIHYDFNGVMMVELPKVSSGTKSQPYLVFKSIHDIHDYDVDGMNLGYLILKTDEEYGVDDGEGIEYFRVIDEKRDLIARKEKNEITILDSELAPIIQNIWGYVPACVLSSQRDAQTDARQSFIWEAIGTADDYLLDSSIHNISKKKHGFPQKWSYDVPCKMCNGESRFPIYGDYADGVRPITGYAPCAHCVNGSINPSPSKAVIKPMPDAANPDIGDPFGWVTPDIESIRFQTEEMERLELIIENSIFSTPNYKQQQQKTDVTATGEVFGVSAKQDKLNRFSNNGEKVEQFLTDTIARAIYKSSFRSSIVKWGRKYYILSENELETMFKAAKDAGVSAGVLKSYLEDLIYVRYATDPIALERQLKLFEAEPFVHMTIQEVQSLTYCAISDKFLKTYFNDYVEQIEREQPNLIPLGTVEQLIIELQKLNALKMTDANGQTTSDPNNPNNQQQTTNSKQPTA